MKIGKVNVLMLCLVVISLFSCKKDDDNGGDTTVPLLSRSDQQSIDNESINTYLNNHYYNSSHFDVSNPDARILDLVITELEENETEAPIGSTKLIEAVDVVDIVFEETDYKYYVLKLKQGSGDHSPKFSDDIRVVYDGFTLDNVSFDGNNIDAPAYWSLLGTIAGWGKVFPMFNEAESFSVENDGVVNYSKPGVGVMFIPSGLAYFNATGTPSDALLRKPLVFKFELLQVFERDHDSDGIPSYLEDLNGDGEFSIADADDDTVTHDDTDDDNTPNAFDADDDGDGIPTKEEIENEFIIKTYNRTLKSEIEDLSLAPNEVLVVIKKENDGSFTGTTITSTDSDGDGILDYLDAE